MGSQREGGEATRTLAGRPWHRADDLRGSLCPVAQWQPPTVAPSAVLAAVSAADHCELSLLVPSPTRSQSSPPLAVLAAYALLPSQEPRDTRSARSPTLPKPAPRSVPPRAPRRRSHDSHYQVALRVAREGPGFTDPPATPRRPLPRAHPHPTAPASPPRLLCCEARERTHRRTPSVNR